MENNITDGKGNESPPLFTPKELTEVTRKFSVIKVPGPDGIQNQVIGTTDCTVVAGYSALSLQHVL